MICPDGYRKDVFAPEFCASLFAAEDRHFWFLGGRPN